MLVFTGSGLIWSANTNSLLVAVPTGVQVIKVNTGFVSGSSKEATSVGPTIFMSDTV